MFLRKPKTIPDQSDALPGRDQPIELTEPHTVLGTPLLPPFPEGIEHIVVGMGCFWGAERIFWQTPGVYTTAVGYAGGSTPNPTYREVCSGMTGHTEAVLVAFDPKRVSTEEILRLFWEGHDPTQGMRQGNDSGTQYRSAIYWHTPEQHDLRDRNQGCLRRGSARGAGAARSRPRSPRPARSTRPRTTTSSTSRRTRAATAASAEPASRARSGWASPRRRASRTGRSRAAPGWCSRRPPRTPGR